MIRKTVLFAALFGFHAFGQTEIYSEDFESGLPATYTIVDNDGLTPNSAVSEYSAAWIQLTDPADASNTIVGSTSYFEPTGQADRWLITPAITLGAYGNHAYWKGKSHDPSFPDSYYVLVSKTDTQISSFTDTLLLVNSELDDWTERTGNLSELGLDNETVHLAFVNRTNNGFKLYLDSIRVEKDDPASTTTLSSVKVNVYPNPANHIVHISGIESINSVRVLGLNGQVLLEESALSLDISSLAPGRYIVEVMSDTEIARSQLIKN